MAGSAVQVLVHTQQPIVHRLVRLRQAEHELLHHKLMLRGPLAGDLKGFECGKAACQSLTVPLMRLGHSLPRSAGAWLMCVCALQVQSVFSAAALA